MFESRLRVVDEGKGVWRELKGDRSVQGIALMLIFESGEGEFGYGNLARSTMDSPQY
jgi:hypothetical protein